jgi:membrane protein implicated in regulation of membrane protease activity
VKTNLTAAEIAGFGGIVVAFVAVFAMLGLDGQSWGAIGLLAVFLVLLVAYRTWLKRRHA